jgi:hypothetical protein
MNQEKIINDLVGANVKFVLLLRVKKPRLRTFVFLAYFEIISSLDRLTPKKDQKKSAINEYIHQLTGSQQVNTKKNRFARWRNGLNLCCGFFEPFILHHLKNPWLHSACKSCSAIWHFPRPKQTVHLPLSGTIF